MSEIVELYAKYIGRKVSVRIMSPEETIAWHTERKSLPSGEEAFLSNWVTIHKSWELGEADYVTPTLGEILGRPPKTLEEEAAEIFSPTNKLDTKDFAGIEEASK